MSFLGKIFKKSKKKEKREDHNLRLSKNVGVPYNEELIQKLIKDHRSLVEEFTKIAKIAQSKKYKHLKKYLKAFKINLEIHNYSEKVQLYIYLKNKYSGTDSEDFIDEMAKSAEEIYKDVFFFLKKYEAIEFNDQHLATFLNELEAIGKILQARIEVEESELYTMYKK